MEDLSKVYCRLRAARFFSFFFWWVFAKFISNRIEVQLKEDV